MKYTTNVTKVEEVEVDVCPKKILKELLRNQYRKLPCYHLSSTYDYRYYTLRDNGALYRVDVSEGADYGHYDERDTYYDTDITEDVPLDLLNKIRAYYTVIDSIKDSD